MVMEASPSPQNVGREFVRQYYTLLNKAPAHLHRFYNNYSSFVHGGLDAPNRETLPVVGQKQIHNRIQQLNFRDCHAKISQVDSQATLGNGVVVQVTGELSNGGAPMRRFTQTFVLAAQSPKKYYVHNDIFRYQDIVFSDEEGEASGRSEGEEEEAGGVSGAGGVGGAYFPPPAAFPAPAFPAAHAPLVSPPPAQPLHTPHVNGHPPPHDDSRHLVAALQATSLSGSVSEREIEPEPVCVAPAVEPAPAPAPEPEPEPEPEREPSPLPTPAACAAPSTPPAAATSPVTTSPPVAPEPKTYANLLKSGGGSSSGPSRVSPPTSAPAPVAAAPPAPAPVSAPAPAVAHHEQRARPQRPQRDNQQLNDGARRYSDSQQLFLGNLPHSATEEELRALFARFGPVAELRVHGKPAAPGAPRHPNYGFITYETAQAAHDCLTAAPLYFPPDSAEGVKLNVEEKKTRGREPPRRRPASSHRAAFAPRPPYRR